MIRAGLKWFWYTLAALIIGIAVLVSLGRLLMPTLDTMAPRFERYLEKKTGAEVSISEVKGAWRGFGPEVTVEGIDFRSPVSKELLLQIGRLHISLDIPRSLLAGDPVLRGFELDKLDVAVALDQQGQLILPGIAMQTGDDPVSALYIIRSLLRHQQVAISNALIRYQRADGDVFDLRLPTLAVRNRPGFHQLLGDLQLHEGGSGKLVLELSDFPLGANDTMSLYLESDQLQLERLPIPVSMIGVDIEQGKLQLKLWSNWRDGSWKDAQADLNISALQLRNEQGARKQIQEFSGAINVQRVDDDLWRLRSQDLKLISGDQDWPPLWLQGEIHRRVEGRLHWQLDFGEIDLARLLTEVQFSSKLTGEWREQLNALALATHVPIVQLDLLSQDEQLLDWAMAAEFAELQYQSETLPVISGVSGRLLLSDNEGALRLRGQNGQLDFHDVFRGPLAFDTLDIAGRWQQQDDDWLISVPRLQFRHGDADIDARAQVLLLDQQEPELALYAELRHGNGANKSAYFPIAVMRPNLVEYLDQAIADAKVEKAVAVIRGPLRGMPYREHEGVFQIDADVRDASFEFDSDWPEVNQLQARLQFIGDQMQIDIASAKLASWQVDSGKVVLPHMTGASTPLQVEASGHGDAGAGITILEQSDVASIGKTLNTLFTMQGDVGVDLQLAIPMAKGQQTSVDGKIRLQQNRIVLNALALPLRETQGEVHFNEHGLSGGKVSAELLGGALLANISHEQQAARIQFEAEVEHADIARWQPYPLQRQVSGRMKLDGNLRLPDAASQPLVLELQSDLQGIALDLPAPFSKTAEQARVTKAHVVLAESSRSFSASMAELLRIEGEQKSGDEWRTELLLGDAQFTGHHQGFSIRGDLERVELEQWLPIIEQAVAHRELNVGESLYASDQPSTINWTPRLALDIEQLNAFGYPLQQVQLGGHGQQQGYQLDVNSEALTGLLRWQQDLPLQIDLSDFNLKTGNGENEAAATENHEQPKRWPEMDFRCAQCRWNDLLLGDVNATLRHRDQADKLQFNIELPKRLTVKAEGEWLPEPNQTRIKGTMQTPDIAALAETWKFARTITESSATMQFELHWPGQLTDISGRRMVGNMSVDVSEGVIANASDSGARVFSLLSLQSLLRRLSLDFSDLFQKGFHFDQMSGTFTIADGKAKTTDARIDGVSADVAIQGETDFVNKTLNQTMQVQPELSSSLPVLAGWVISPQTGVLVWLMNKIFIEPAVDVVTGLEYTVTGSWEDPQVVEQKRTQKEIELPKEELLELQNAETEGEPKR